MPVPWVRLMIRAMAIGRVAFRTAFVTDLPVGRAKVADIVACGRSRRRVENSEFNVLIGPAAIL